MLALTRVALIRLARDRTNVFFLLVFPLLLVLLVGVQFGGGTGLRVGVVHAGDATGEAIVTALQADDVAVDVLSDEASARAAARDGQVDGVMILPPFETGTTADVRWLALPTGTDVAARATVEAVIATETRDARLAAALAPFDVVAGTSSAAPAVTTTLLGGSAVSEFAGLGQFDLGAHSQLLLFVFITSLTGSGAIVRVRRLGVLRRVLAGPTSPSAVIVGLGLGQLLIALLQAVIIVAGTSFLFDVSWGDPVATGSVILLFSAVAAAAGLLLGALLTNEEQAGGVGVPLALVLAALGGSMLPLELFSDTMQRVARFTPHAWGNLALAEIVRRDGGLTDILPSLAVLGGLTVTLGGAAAVMLRRRLAD